MTERRVERGPARGSRRRTAIGVAWAATALFLALLAVLAMRVAAGSDPALRARAAVAPRPPRRVLVRRIYERRVIIHLPPSAPAQPAQASQSVSSSGGYASPLTTRTS